MSQSNVLDVVILGRELRVACPPDEQKGLLEAVAYLDKKMREISEAGKIASVERIAIMAALNIANELLTERSGAGVPNADTADYGDRIRAMHAAIESELADQEKLF